MSALSLFGRRIAPTPSRLVPSGCIALMLLALLGGSAHAQSGIYNVTVNAWVENSGGTLVGSSTNPAQATIPGYGTAKTFVEPGAIHVEATARGWGASGKTKSYASGGYSDVLVVTAPAGVDLVSAEFDLKLEGVLSRSGDGEYHVGYGASIMVNNGFCAGGGNPGTTISESVSKAYLDPYGYPYNWDPVESGTTYVLSRPATCTIGKAADGKFHFPMVFTGNATADADPGPTTGETQASADYYSTILMYVKILTPNTTVTSVSGYVYPEPPARGLTMTTGLLGYWRADGDSFNAIVGETRTTAVGFVPGKLLQAFQLDGSRSVITVPDITRYHPGTGSMTAYAWIKTQATGIRNILGKSECSGSSCAYSQWFLLLRDGKLWANVRDTDRGGADSYGGQTLDGTHNVADGAWHHVALVRDVTAGELRLYVDGAVDASAPLTAGSRDAIKDDDGEADPLMIGGVPAGGTLYYPFAGLIDEVAYYNRALTGAEINHVIHAVQLAADTAPEVEADGPYTVVEGGTVSLAATGSDVDGDAITYAWDMDGDATYEAAGQTAAFSASTIGGPSTHTVTVQACDAIGLCATDNATVNVLNAPPTITSVLGPTDRVPQGIGATLTVAFSDPGTSDTHVCDAAWGDGQTTVGQVTEAGGSGTCTISHQYSAVGVFHATVTLSDDDGASDTGAADIEVYNPDDIAPTTTDDAPAGWQTADFTVWLVCTDNPDGSGCQATRYRVDQQEWQSGTLVPIATEGDHLLEYYSVDQRGNVESTKSTGAKLDKTGPIVGLAVTAGTQGANGWYTSDVTIATVGFDDVGGPVTCTADQLQSEETTGLAFEGACTNEAGLTTTAEPRTVKLDKTPPTANLAVTSGTEGTDGWYVSDVTVEMTGDDTISGPVTCTPAQYQTTETSGTVYEGACTNDAGLTTNADPLTVRLDKTSPTASASASPPPNGNGWNNTDVTVAFSGDDGSGSGILSCSAPVTLTGEGAGQSATGTCIDRAGNANAPVTAAGINIDETAPLIAGARTPDPNERSWNSTDVVVSFTCADAGSVQSGIGTNTVAGATVSTEGPNQSVTSSGICSDEAGNVAQPATVDSINIDHSPPAIAASRSPDANANGWNNSTVTVSFTCDDEGPAGIASCPDPVTISIDGAGQWASGTATDNAGNTSTATVTDINIDTGTPAVSGAPTTSPNDVGWYNQDVAIHWTVSDDLSGLDPSTVPSDSVVGGEGQGMSLDASVQDLAGNRAIASVSGLNVDRTPPVTRITAPDGWNSTNVVVEFVPNDALSGIDQTYYVLDGGEIQAGTSVDIQAEGIHTLTYWSMDVAGNSESHNAAEIKIDRTAPTISHTQDPVANANGWNNADVIVTFICAAHLSGVRSCTEPQTVTTEGREQVVTGVAVDNAGNSAQDQAVVSIDKTPPTVSASPDRQANDRAWYDAAVRVSFACDDTLSGIADCPGQQVLAEGASQSANGTAYDAAGNSSTAVLEGINVDETPPTLSGAPRNAPNANGWYSEDVNVVWTCSDDLAGIDGACPADSVVTGEGDSLSGNASVSDIAGNRAAATVDGLHIDRTPPSITASATTNGNPYAPGTWTNQDVVVIFACDDGLSGVDSVSGAATMSGEGADQSVTGSCTDKAGNRATVTFGNISIDRTPPTIGITVPGAGAEYGVGQTVMAAYTCADQAQVSGLASCNGSAPTGTPIDTSSAGAHVFTVNAMDNAGNRMATVVQYNVVASQRQVTQNVLAEMKGLLPTLGKQDGDRLGKVIQHLTKALDWSLWLDGNHPDAQRGDKVFNEVKDAVVKLDQLAMDSTTTVPPTTSQQWIDSLVLATRALATIAIGEASGGEPIDLDLARAELALGDGDKEQGMVITAILHYRNAWKHAIAAPR